MLVRVLNMAGDEGAPDVSNEFLDYKINDTGAGVRESASKRDRTHSELYVILRTFLRRRGG